MEKLSSLWLEIQKSNRLPGSGLTSSCQEELLELMRQLDIMLTSKRRDWENQTDALRSQLDMKDKEFQIQTSTLQHKNRQVEDLTCQLREASLSRDGVMQQYETQLLDLNNEVKRMKREYEKLHKKYTRQTKETQRLRLDSTEEIEDRKSDTKRYKDKLEDVQQRLKDSEQIQKSLRKQVEALGAQNRTLSEKCEFIQHQSHTYQSQIDRRRQLQNNTEYSLKNTITQLEGQLERSANTIKSQEEKIKTLKTSLNDAMNAHKRAMNDNERLLDDLKKANTSIRHLEGENQQYEVEVRSRDDLLRAANEDAYQYSHSISILEQSLSAKDDVIKDLGDSAHQEESDQLAMLQQSLREMKDVCRNHQKTEKMLRDEVSVLDSRLQSAKNLRHQLEERESELQHIKINEIRSLQVQIQELQTKMSILERTHDGELDGMKVKLTQLTTDLHERQASIAILSDKTSRLEQQLALNHDLLDGREAELKVALAQTNVLNMENRHLRRDFMEKLGTVCSRLGADDQLQVLSGQYSAIVSKLESENENLQEDISKLKNEMAHRKSLEASQIRSLASTSAPSPCNSIQNRADQGSPSRSLGGMDSTVAEYESQLRILHNQKERLEQELQYERTEGRRVDNSSPFEQNNSVGTILDSEPMSLIHTFHDIESSPLSDYELESSADAAAELFLSQEQERAKELERIIDSHIEDLRVRTENTITRAVQIL